MKLSQFIFVFAVVSGSAQAAMDQCASYGLPGTLYECKYERPRHLDLIDIQVCRSNDGLVLLNGYSGYPTGRMTGDRVGFHHSYGGYATPDFYFDVQASLLKGGAVGTVSYDGQDYRCRRLR